jgi:hypothetical protein
VRSRQAGAVGRHDDVDDADHGRGPNLAGLCEIGARCSGRDFRHVTNVMVGAHKGEMVRLCEELARGLYFPRQQKPRKV